MIIIAAHTILSVFNVYSLACFQVTPEMFDVHSGLNFPNQTERRKYLGKQYKLSNQHIKWFMHKFVNFNNNGNFTDILIIRISLCLYKAYVAHVARYLRCGYDRWNKWDRWNICYRLCEKCLKVKAIEHTPTLIQDD